MKGFGVKVVAAVVITVFAAGILLSGDKVQLAWLRFYSVAIVIASGVLAVWDQMLWRLSIAQKFNQVPRNLRGTWMGTLESLWVDPGTGSQTQRKTVYLVVRQTALTVSATLLTDEGRSSSNLAAVSTGADAATLDYLYVSSPDSKFEQWSRMHRGSATLDITGKPATRMRGRYWTDRDSKGQLDFTDRRKALAEDFEQAAALFEGQP